MENEKNKKTKLLKMGNHWHSFSFIYFISFVNVVGRFGFYEMQTNIHWTSTNQNSFFVSREFSGAFATDLLIRFVVVTDTVATAGDSFAVFTTTRVLCVKSHSLSDRVRSQFTWVRFVLLCAHSHSHTHTREYRIYTNSLCTQRNIM